MHARSFSSITRTHKRRPSRRARAGFSLTELLVVIGIIVLLLGLLLVALGGVRDRARRASAESTMLGVLQAAEAYQSEHRVYPGLVPEARLAAGPDAMTTTENMLLALMGGARVKSPSSTAQELAEFTDFANCGDPNVRCLDLGEDWEIKVDFDRIGEGPIVNGKPSAPYFTPSGREIGIVKGQVGDMATGGVIEPGLPDLVDPWGQPILYLRRQRPLGTLVPSQGSPSPPQFVLEGLEGYVTSTGLGELEQNQTGANGSILNLGNQWQQAAVLGQAIRHPAFGEAVDPTEGTSRGEIVLISAGPDGVYFSRTDGPGKTAPIESPGLSMVEFFEMGPAVFEDFDDIRVFGGG